MLMQSIITNLGDIKEFPFISSASVSQLKFEIEILKVCGVLFFSFLVMLGKSSSRLI